MKKRNQKRILRIEPFFSLTSGQNGSSGLHFVLSFVLGVALCALQWTGQKSETFHRHFIAVSDRVAGDCKVLIVLCICILFAMWIKKASLLFIYIYIKVCYDAHSSQPFKMLINLYIALFFNISYGNYLNFI